MRIYLINELTGFRAYVDDTQVINIAKNDNRELHLNDKYIALLNKLTNECSNMKQLYNRLRQRLAFDCTSVFKDF